MSNGAMVVSWICRIAAAFLMGMTLYFKFMGAELPVAIFATLGVDPWGRYVIGVLELFAILMLIFPKTVSIGAVLTIGLMGGAILSHVTVLGISLEGIKENLPEASMDQVPDPSLFAFAWVTLLCAVILLVIHKDQLNRIIKRERAAQ